MSRCHLPTNLFNQGRFVVSINASVCRVRRYFAEDHVLMFTVDADASPVGGHWPEDRGGALRMPLDWEITIEEV